jgi:hypothetical protein
MVTFMNQAPGDGALVIKARQSAATGPAAAPKPLTNARTWETRARIRPNARGWASGRMRIPTSSTF